MTLVSRYILWSAFITPTFGLTNSILLYLLYTWIGSNYIFINFAVSHTHLPTVDKEDVSVSFMCIHTLYLTIYECVSVLYPT